LVSVSPIRDVSGAIIGALTIARDLSRYKEAEARIQEGKVGSTVRLSFGSGRICCDCENWPSPCENAAANIPGRKFFFTGRAPPCPSGQYHARSQLRETLQMGKYPQTVPWQRTVRLPAQRNADRNYSSQEKDSTVF
jgi:hypothetical protein